jgi:hypothetical protein
MMLFCLNHLHYILIGCSTIHVDNALACISEVRPIERYPIMVEPPGRTKDHFDRNALRHISHESALFGWGHRIRARSADTAAGRA